MKGCAVSDQELCLAGKVLELWEMLKAELEGIAEGSAGVEAQPLSLDCPYLIQQKMALG